MFLEHTGPRGPRKGWIEVICGSMFSGKTEELIRRLRRAEFAKQKVEIFKPGVDKRYHDNDVVSHEGTSIRSTPVPGSSHLLLLTNAIEVVGIDEAQFFDSGLPAVCEQMANSGIRVIIAGLDMDFQGRPFGPMPALMAMAEYVTKVHAICMHCGDLAQYSHRTTPSQDLVVLGETDSYEPLCRNCFIAARSKQAAP
ncbi:MAG: thymidine kinase [Flavobacteriales bacterium]|nr:thymidine kinase [Flavobacteriales bacterium]